MDLGICKAPGLNIQINGEINIKTKHEHFMSFLSKSQQVLTFKNKVGSLHMYQTQMPVYERNIAMRKYSIQFLLCINIRIKTTYIRDVAS